MIFETSITAGLALGMPLVFDCFVAAGMSMCDGWIGRDAMTWQFVLGIGMACAVTALSIPILFTEKLEILGRPIGQRILRYGSLDDFAIWGVLALIVLDWTRAGRQVGFLLVLAVFSYGFRKLMVWLQERDHWYIGLIWLAACGFAAYWGGFALHGGRYFGRDRHGWSHHGW